MMIGSFLFKQKARESLKGNWQNALLVTFFSGILLTVTQVAQSVLLKDVRAVITSMSYMLESLYSKETLSAVKELQLRDLTVRLRAALDAVPVSTWALLGGLMLASLLLTPVLLLCRDHYFIRLTGGRDIGVVQGLTARIRLWGRALWLYVLMAVRIWLWSLLFVIPGILAAIRYSMAPYYLANDPELTAGEAIEQSKAVMQGKKLSYFMLLFSFVWWNLVANAVQILVASFVGTIPALVAGQFVSLAINTYINASVAAFFCGVSRMGGLKDMLEAFRRRMREAGAPEDIRIPGEDDIELDEDEPDDKPDDDAGEGA